MVFLFGSHMLLGQNPIKLNEGDSLKIEYNGNGTISHSLTFKNNTLNGYCVVNWSEGESRYDGFYKNDYRDSIWRYYDGNNEIIDKPKYRLARECKYEKGIEILISAWDKHGVQTVKNGNGFIVEEGDYYKVTEYSNGLENGKEETKRKDGTLIKEKYYKDGLVVKELNYFDSNKVSAISEWVYPFPPKIDTNRAWIDTWITNIFYNSIEFEYLAFKNGYWVAHYDNGVKIFEGNYLDGKRIGIWEWKYKNGNTRIIGDYNKGTFEHSDSTGKVISKLKREYLSLLNDDNWFLNQKLDTSTVKLSKENSQTVTPRFIFYYDGKLEINSFLECGKDIEWSTNFYELVGDKLTIILPTNKNNAVITYRFKIVSANDNEIRLERLK